MEVLQNRTGGSPQVHAEVECRIVCCFAGQRVVAANDEQSVRHILDGIDNVCGFKIARFPTVDVEDLVRV